jgi:hypothetical protein
MTTNVTALPSRHYHRTYDTRINLAIARHVPSLMEASARVFSLGDEAKLNSLFEAADFRDVEITTERHRFVLPSFDAYFEPFEQGAGSPGQRRQIHRRSRRRKNRDVLEVVNDYLMGRCRRSAVGLLITGASKGRRRVQVDSLN